MALPPSSAPLSEFPPLMFRRWTREEDQVLLQHVGERGTKNWSLLKNSGLLPDRDNKACCNRYRILKEKLEKQGGQIVPRQAPSGRCLMTEHSQGIRAPIPIGLPVTPNSGKPDFATINGSFPPCNPLRPPQESAKSSAVGASQSSQSTTLKSVPDVEDALPPLALPTDPSFHATSSSTMPPSGDLKSDSGAPAGHHDLWNLEDLLPEIMGDSILSMPGLHHLKCEATDLFHPAQFESTTNLPRASPVPPQLPAVCPPAPPSPDCEQWATDQSEQTTSSAFSGPWPQHAASGPTKTRLMLHRGQSQLQGLGLSPDSAGSARRAPALLNLESQFMQSGASPKFVSSLIQANNSALPHCPGATAPQRASQRYTGMFHYPPHVTVPYCPAEHTPALQPGYSLDMLFLQQQQQLLMKQHMSSLDRSPLKRNGASCGSLLEGRRSWQFPGAPDSCLARTCSAASGMVPSYYTPAQPRTGVYYDGTRDSRVDAQGRAFGVNGVLASHPPGAIEPRFHNDAINISYRQLQRNKRARVAAPVHFPYFDSYQTKFG